MESRRAIVGLGNPGQEYERTRHNVGFVVVDRFAAREGSVLVDRAHGALWARLESDALGVVFLAKPQRYMNRSGEPLLALLEEWELEATDLLIVHDDVDLELGRLKLKRGGGTGGHRGLQSIEEETGTRDFFRLRFGVGRPEEGQETAQWVLEPFSEEAGEPLGEALARAERGVRDWLRLDFQAAQKNVNTPPEKPVESGESGC